MDYIFNQAEFLENIDKEDGSLFTDLMVALIHGNYDFFPFFFEHLKTQQNMGKEIPLFQLKLFRTVLFSTVKEDQVGLLQEIRESSLYQLLPEQATTDKELLINATLKNSLKILAYYHDSHPEVFKKHQADCVWWAFGEGQISWPALEFLLTKTDCINPLQVENIKIKFEQLLKHNYVAQELKENYQKFMTIYERHQLNQSTPALQNKINLQNNTVSLKIKKI